MKKMGSLLMGLLRMILI
ncbi:hypothetical protein Goari_021487 [Gossypium aridum]|uniref:Uncharacterized protein n=1 Tax=Gossypium aridum TaxID=34290 RepID=A0A7J8YEG0_GOSAI|nr:hypothetical protein [Gossypium aridum]